MHFYFSYYPKAHSVTRRKCHFCYLRLFITQKNIVTKSSCKFKHHQTSGTCSSLPLQHQRTIPALVQPQQGTILPESEGGWLWEQHYNSVWHR